MSLFLLNSTGGRCPGGQILLVQCWAEEVPFSWLLGYLLRYTHTCILLICTWIAACSIICIEFHFCTTLCRYLGNKWLFFVYFSFDTTKDYVRFEESLLSSHCLPRDAVNYREVKLVVT